MKHMSMTTDPARMSGSTRATLARDRGRGAGSETTHLRAASERFDPDVDKGTARNRFLSESHTEKPCSRRAAKCLAASGRLNRKPCPSSQ